VLLKDRLLGQTTTFIGKIGGLREWWKLRLNTSGRVCPDYSCETEAIPIDKPYLALKSLVLTVPYNRFDAYLRHYGSKLLAHERGVLIRMATSRRIREVDEKIAFDLKEEQMRQKEKQKACLPSPATNQEKGPSPSGQIRGPPTKLEWTLTQELGKWYAARKV